MLAQTRPFLSNLQSLINFKSANQEMLSRLYLLLITSLAAFQIIFLVFQLGKKLSMKSLLMTAGAITLIFSLAYPFLSYDIFTYLFSAKMVWTYHVNPYVRVPEEFMSSDLWVSFIRNIQFTYAYGPVLLLYFLIPMIIFSGKRFILNFFGLKLMNAVLFYLSGILLLKLNNQEKRIFAIWFFNPFLIFELLVNSHNELLMISLFFLFVFYSSQKNFGKAVVTLLASVLTKYISLVGAPLIFLNKKRARYFLKILSLGLPVFLGLQKIRGVQVWYYAWVYLALPLANLKTKSWIIISSIGLLFLMGYFPFVKTGFWGAAHPIPNSQLLFYFLILMIFLNELNLLKFNFSQNSFITYLNQEWQKIRKK